MSVISVFSGAGGDSLGLTQAGFEVEVAVDIDADCLKSYHRNLPGATVYRRDVRDLSLCQNDFDGIVADASLISGGGPCQASSRLNFRGVGEERNQYTLEIIRLAVEGNLRVIVIENVVTFALKEEVMRAGRKAGYHMFSRILDASKYGVPQKRRRWICIGIKDKDTFEWPEPHTRKLTVGDALQKMGSVWGTAKRSEETLERLDELDKSPLTWKSVSGGEFANGIAWSLDKPAPCLTHTEKTYQKIVGMRGTIPQSLSAIIQGFPADWRFMGYKYSVAQQIVNACPPPLAKAIGLAIRRRLSTQEAS